MFRIDQPTVAGSLPTPSAAGVPGFFTNGNPALGIPATVVDQDWFNRMQEELMSLLSAASITPVKSNYTQVFQAILAAGLMFDTGVANALVASPGIPLTSLVVGTQLTLVPLNTNTGASTLNVSSLGALSVLRPDGTVVQPGDLPAGRRTPIIYDGSAWRLVNWPVRQRLGGNLTLFCNPQTGSDSNNGLTSGTAFGSLQGVWNYLYQNVDVTGFVVTVQCSGTFTVGLNAQTVVVGSTPQSVVFNFASGATISVTSSMCFAAANPGVGFTVNGPVVMAATGGGPTSGYAMNASYGAQIISSGANFGVCGAAHINANQGGLVAVSLPTISGSSPAHANAYGGEIIEQNTTVTLTGTPAFSTGFAVASVCGQIYMPSNTYVGTATGPRFALSLNGVVNTNGGAAATYLPGNSSPTPPYPTGGQYG